MFTPTFEIKIKIYSSTLIYLLFIELIFPIIFVITFLLKVSNTHIYKPGIFLQGLVKPNIVFFGEDLPRTFYYYLKDFPQADLLVRQASLQVGPITVKDIPGQEIHLLHQKIKGKYLRLSVK